MNRRFRTIQAVRAHAGDLVCIVVAIIIGDLASVATSVPSSAYAPANIAIGLIAAAALWWRQRAPFAVACFTFVAGAVAPFAAGAALVAVYVVASHYGRRVPPALAALYIASTLTGLALFPDQNLGSAAGLLWGLVLTAAAFGWGLSARAQRQLVTALAERAHHAELNQQMKLAEARRAERNRIAAEMHDVLAHRLSMLSLHAGAIELRPNARPEDLSAAAAIVRTNAHQALEELRGVLHLLRDDAEPSLAPQPSAADIDRLLAECRAAGMQIDLTSDVADLTAIPPEIGRHAYRIIQEGLTNARKHAPGQSVCLVLGGVAGEGLSIEISNPPGGSPPPVPGAGAGLIGLRERVEQAGGAFRRDANHQGRHCLSAWLPWPA